jgi:histidinol-phosphate/aromatic aminotransferase/cobyric acid decarboxylase-like protein
MKTTVQPISGFQILPENKRIRLHKNEPKASVQNTRNLYPTEENLLQKIADYHGVSVKNIILTAGADDGLRIVFGRRDKGSTIMLDPDFQLYKKWADAYGHTITLLPLGFPNPKFPKDLFESCLSHNASMVVLSTVSNPTGLEIPDGLIEECSNKFPETLFVVDEVYSDYINADFTQLATQKNNVICIRSLSKLGVPGLRVGYLVATENIINKLKPFALTHPVAGPCLVPAIGVLSDKSKIKKIISQQKLSASYLSSSLIDNGFEVISGHANWIHVNFKDLAKPIFEKLKEVGVDVLPQVHPYLNGWLRISTPDIASVKKLVFHLNQILKSPFQEKNGVLKFDKAFPEIQLLTAFSFLAKVYGEFVTIDHFNIIYANKEQFLQQIEIAKNNGYEIVEGPGVYPTDFCSEFESFPQDLAMHFASIKIPSKGLIVIAAPCNPNDQLSLFTANKGADAVHHIAIKVQNIRLKINYWATKGFKQKSPLAEDDDIMQCFLVNEAGQIVELIERTDNQNATFTCNNILTLRKSE